MKRTGHIFEKVIDKENIKEAILNASKGKRGRKAVKRCLADLDKTAEEIQHLLISGKFKPKYPTIKIIHDERRGKDRKIACPNFYPDQVIHHALMQPLVPIAMKRMIRNTYGSIPGRGQHGAVHAVEKWIRISYRTRYVFQFDVRKFYQHVTPELVRSSLRHFIKDERYISELMKIVNSYDDGLPIGFYTSQWLANIVLDPLDHFIESRGFKVCRYMDDVLVLGNNKRKLHRLKRDVEAWLNARGLSLKDNWQIYKHSQDRPISFLGYKITKERTRIRSSTFLRICRRVRKYCRGQPNLHGARAILSYLGVIVHANSETMLRKHIYPLVSISELKGIVRYASRKQHQTTCRSC